MPPPVAKEVLRTSVVARLLGTALGLPDEAFDIECGRPATADVAAEGVVDAPPAPDGLQVFETRPGSNPRLDIVLHCGAIIPEPVGASL